LKNRRSRVGRTRSGQGSPASPATAKRAMGVPILSGSPWSAAERRRRQNWGNRRSLRRPRPA